MTQLVLRIDAITDAINKLLDKAQQVAPTVWAAALHQVAINARLSFLWGVGWTVVAGLFTIIALGIPVAYLFERKNYRKAMNAVHELSELNAQSTALVPSRLRETLSNIRYEGHNPNENLPITAWSSVVAWIVVILAGVMAVTSYWNAWQMSQNPTWWAIQLLKG